MAKKQLKIADIVFAGVRPSRASAKLKVRHSARGGYTTFAKRRVQEVVAPLGRGAYARTIRIHELLHANKTPVTRTRNAHPIAANAIEDARLHSVVWRRDRMPRAANRDCLATGLLDLRTLHAAYANASADNWNHALLIALRALSILDKLGEQKQRQYASAKLVETFGSVISSELASILDVIKSRRRIKALAAFTALMRSDGDENIGKGDGSYGMSSNCPMRIVRLPMPAPTSKLARRTSFARSGARMNRSRLARAVASGSSAGLFIRQRYLPGGTYLFDASGSMQVSAERLNEICQAVPAARIAYYSGDSADASGCYGELVIYADNNRRAVECTNMHGGNSVDLYALKWLLSQPSPRVIVCDGGFCGGPAGQDIETAKLLSRAIGDGELTLFPSIQALENELSRVRGKLA